MRSLLFSILALVAFAAAVPFRLQDHVHGRRALGARAASLTGHSESYDGSCGTWGGATCKAGFCCGPNGWCGNAELHCGAGCQSGFGECGTTPATSQSPVSNPDKYGAPNKPTGPLTQPGLPSSYAPIPTSPEQPDTLTPPTAYPSTSAETTASEPTQSVSPVNSPSSSPQSSSEPATYAPTSSSPVSSSAAPTDTTSSTSSYSSTTPSTTSGGGGAQSTGGPYINTFKGDGSKSAGWPGQDQWLPFETLWEINQDIMTHSCSNAWSLGANTDNTEAELAEVKAAIEDLSAKTQVDKAFIYVVMQQESLGCVRVQTTKNAHDNPGLFQSNQGAGSCNDGTGLKIPCPESEIHQMVEDGVAGTRGGEGEGLQQLLAKATGEAAQKYYRAARMYNSGSLDASGSLGRGGATACYCSDIANRLLGWSQGTSKCSVAEVSA